MNKISKITRLRAEPRYDKQSKARSIYSKNDVAKSAVITLISIREIDDIELIKFWNSRPKITPKTSTETVSTFFEQLIDELHLLVRDPIIKKYKNCVFFGEKGNSGSHQGILHYYNHKVYYG